MMLPPSRQPPIDPPPVALPPVGKATSAIAVEPVSSHGDYNHQPLLVSGLGHYVKPEEDNRFHVSWAPVQSRLWSVEAAIRADGHP